jgi:hypothetical protein
MSDNYTDDDLDLDIEDDSTDIRGLRRAANQAKKLKAEMAQIRRELAFAKAGLPLDDPKMNYFIRGYDGEMEPDIIRETAMQAGFLVSQGSSQEPQTNQGFQQSQQRVMSASAGAISEDNSEAAAMSRMEAAMQEGGLEAMLDVARQYGIPTSTDY